eukprot:jgi/Bigna1/89216/estExt_fgenesh1_pg.C_450125
MVSTPRPLHHSSSLQVTMRPLLLATIACLSGFTILIQGFGTIKLGLCARATKSFPSSTLLPSTSSLSRCSSRQSQVQFSSSLRFSKVKTNAGFGSPTETSSSSEKKIPQDLALMTSLLPKLGQAKCYGVDPRDYIEQPPIESKIASSIDGIAAKLEENFAKRGGYSVTEWKGALAGEWQLLFTTSKQYRDNRGVTGLSGLPGYGLKGVYQRIIPVEDDDNIDGKSVMIEVLTAPFGKATKNELRGAYKVYSKNDAMKKKQRLMISSTIDMRRWHWTNPSFEDIQAGLMLYNTYVTKDAKLRFGRSPSNALFIFGRVGPDGDGTEGGINEILSRDRLPWDGGSPLLRVF